MLSLQSLTSSFAPANLSPLSIDLAIGQHLTLSGPSGCGKTSLLKVLAGLMPAQSGEIQWQQQRVTDSNLVWWRKQCCYLPQEPVLGAETISGVLRLPWALKAESTPQPSDERCREVLDLFGLTHHFNGKVDAEVSTLSGGEKQRLAVARALLLERPIWLLDEPTSALDAKSRDRLVSVLSEHAIIQVSISHDPAWVASADQVYDMGNDDE
ncbi:ABC transporter ATP-binding protein [Enterovibrio calviensis]|uniref:ABC transporter ATP-binding protein n=1 Tax=Enterovibrio calviensis TaxID=91359 RepID=UPI000554C66C|nr:ATP-binding cassette domain-containing protein [Enterovibrio calviensis]